MPGHLEAIASGTGIARRANEAGMVRSDGAEIDARWVAEQEDAGDATAQQIMGNARRAFAAAVVTIVDVFNPSVLVVGGGIAIAQGDRLFDPAREALRQSGYSHQAQRGDRPGAARRRRRAGRRPVAGRPCPFGRH